MMTVLLTVVTMALAIPGGLALALRLSPLRRFARRRRPSSSSSARRRSSCRSTGSITSCRPIFDMQLSQLDHRDRRPRLQHLGLQLGDVPRRHRVDPPGPVERRPGARHEQRRRCSARIVLPQAVMRVLPALAIDLGVAVQGHLARLGHRGRRALLCGAARSAPRPTASSRC